MEILLLTKIEDRKQEIYLEWPYKGTCELQTITMIAIHVVLPRNELE